MIKCIVNNQNVEMACLGETVALDVLRRDLGLTGTKEACREGDCGACAVLLGEPESGGFVRYRAVCSCILPAQELDGHHVVTVEGLNGAALTPVQRALVEGGGVQCGFCSPGLVIALTGYLLGASRLDPDDAELAIAGNICRCTGYAGIRRAVAILCDSLGELGDAGPARLERLVALGVLPPYFREIPRRMAEFVGASPRLSMDHLPDETAPVIIAGGTDLFSQRKRPLDGAKIAYLRRDEALRRVVRTDNAVEIGAAATVSELAENGIVAEAFPSLVRALELFASPLIRNRATVGGNLVNASPIGDLSISLLALGAEAILARGDRERRIPLEKLFVGYKKLDLAEGEIVARVSIPTLEKGERFAFSKISRRRLLDIAGVNAAIRIFEQNGTIRSVRVAAGGVAPVPLFLSATSERLVGLPMQQETVELAGREAMAEAAPIDDVRGAAAYKRALLERLVQGLFAELFPDAVGSLPKEVP